MNAWLFDVLQNGTIVDNQSYWINQGLFTNNRLNLQITLNARQKNKRNTYRNDESAIWHFLCAASREIQQKLTKNKGSLILFNDKEYEHNTSEGFIDVTGIDARNFTLTTNNLIGFVRRGDYSLKVSSRFGDAFLQYIIADADGFLELDNFGGESVGDGYEWLLAYLWNVKLKKAYRLGLPKAYMSKTERSSRVRGSIDTTDYFQNKISGKYLCTYREHSYDNPALSLFIKAYEVTKKFTFCQRTRNIYQALLVANQGTKRSRQEILNTPNFTNPFYSDYNILIDLSKKIIDQKGASFDSHNDSSAFFFDVSMLFEYFIHKLIKRSGIQLMSKYDDIHMIPSGSLSRPQRKLEPDLVFSSGDSRYVFDVKYKSFDTKYGVSREDLFQLHTYIGQYGNDDKPLKGCGFIYPMSQEKWSSHNMDSRSGIIKSIIVQQGRQIPFYVMFLKVPLSTESGGDNQGNAEYFAREMSKSCSDFVNVLSEHVTGDTA